jgi:hypothetical protein
MARKPETAAGYPPHALEKVRRTCLTLALKLGSFADELVVVGGLVPSLLIPREANATFTPHVGTVDVDLGLQVTILENTRYAELTEQLQAASFHPDKNSVGKPANHRWIGDGGCSVDFLIARQSEPTSVETRVIGSDLSAVLSDGLPLAFRDRVRCTMTGETIEGDIATRQIWVCGPGAFIVLKALALQNRGENKDAYDLVYLLRNYGRGVEDVAVALRPLLTEPVTTRATATLETDFEKPRSNGPRQAARFLGQENDDAALGDNWGAVQELLRLLGREPQP